MRILIALAFLWVSGVAQAHAKEKHSVQAAVAKVTSTAKAGAEAAAVAAKEGAQAVAVGAQAAPKVDFLSVFKGSLSSHRHSKVVHFPIALGLAAVLFGLLAYRWEGLRSLSRWNLFLAALAALLAILFGRMEEDSVEGAMARQILEVHEAQGYIVGVSLWLTWLLSFMDSLRKIYWILLLLLASVILGTSMLGGALAHGTF